MPHPRAHLCLIAPAIVFVVSFAGVLAFLAGGWFGADGQAGLEFCEASHAGWIKQPANTWSNLGFVVAGFAAAWQAWRALLNPATISPRNRMTATVFYPTLYASVVVFIGPGSMALHASTAVWGGKLDVFSMYLWVAFGLVYAITRWRDLNIRSFTALYVGISALLAMHLLTYIPPVSGTALFGAILTTYALLEGRLMLGAGPTGYRRIWLWLAVGAFGIAFSIWLPSRSGGPLCQPDSLVQGHAVWHLLDALSTYALYRYFCSQKGEDFRSGPAFPELP